MKMNFKIQSESDIITNSSSEVFIKYDKQSVDGFKQKIQEFLNAVNVNLDIDELIEISPLFDCEDDAIQEWQDANNTDRLPSSQELNEYVFQQTGKSFEVGEKLFPSAYAIDVHAKDPKYDELARIIQYLVCPFESDTLYC